MRIIRSPNGWDRWFAHAGNHPVTCAFPCMKQKKCQPPVFQYSHQHLSSYSPNRISTFQQQQAILTIGITSERNMHKIHHLKKMSEGKPGKRERFRSFLNFERSNSSNETKAGPHSRATSESPTPASSAVTLSTSALGGVVCMNETTATETAKDAAHTRKDMAHTQIGKAEEPISTATSRSDGAASLWHKAFNGSGLSGYERETLAAIRIETDSRQIALALGTMAKGIVDGKKRMDWKIQFNGDVIVMRDVGMKIQRWLDRFKQIGDIIIQYDPGHAALPWAGFRLLLKVELCCQLLQLRQPANHDACSSTWISRQPWMRS